MKAPAKPEPSRRYRAAKPCECWVDAADDETSYVESFPPPKESLGNSTR